MKYIQYGFIVLFVGFLSFIYIDAVSVHADLLDTAYEEVFRKDANIGMGGTNGRTTPLALGDRVLAGKGGTPLIVKITKRLLEITVILGVPFLMYGGIKYITAAGDAGAQTNARKFCINVLIGIVLALSSYAIVSLITSITKEPDLLTSTIRVLPNVERL